MQCNVVTYNAAIRAGEKGKQWGHALELFQEMRASNVHAANVITYNAQSHHRQRRHQRS